jgi:prepilin-type N-terminal cleavage/methylation domain-containing protein
VFTKRNNSTKGFTLIEVVVALGILVMLSGFVLVSISAIPQARMREYAETMKSEFELTRNFAKTHGGNATFIIKKVDEGLEISRVGKNLTTETQLFEDHNLALFYKESGDETEYELNVSDADDVEEATLRMTFSQTNGEIIGPHLLDYIIISNGSKNFKFFIKQSSGMIYYDYELDEEQWVGNVISDEIAAIKLPKFVENGTFKDSVQISWTGTSMQPELSYDARNVRISGEYRAIETGQYTITFSLKDPYSTCWADGTKADIVLTWEIK